MRTRATHWGKSLEAAGVGPLLRVLLAGCVTLLACGAAIANNTPPNILILLADDLGYSDLGCYGSEIKTPHLDALAEEGLRYSQFYNTARCWPTRAALLTGYYPQQINRDALPTSTHRGHGQRPAWAPLLPALLEPKGYRSYHSGKWHIDGTPLEAGFDKSYRLSDHNRYFTAQQHFRNGVPVPRQTSTSGYYATTAIADFAIECLQHHAEEYADQPFFQQVTFTAPHFPLQAPGKDIARYSGHYDVGWDNIRAERWRRMRKLQSLPGSLSELEPEIGPPYAFPEAIQQLGPGEIASEQKWTDLTPVQQRFQAAKMEIHAAMITRMDHEIGRILEQLRLQGVYENTVILFLSDNGASAEIMVRGDGHDPDAQPGAAETYLCLGPGWSSAANTPLRRHKTWVHEGGISTPLIVHWPARITEVGQWRHTAGHVIDVVPTLLDLASAENAIDTSQQEPPAKPGKSLAATFDADQEIEREAIWWLHEGNRALRAGDWKLVAAEGEAWELYNLAEDRAETNNLADTSPAKVGQLAKLWQDYTSKFEQLVARPD